MNQMSKQSIILQKDQQMKAENTTKLYNYFILLITYRNKINLIYLIIVSQALDVASRFEKNERKKEA